MAKLMPPLLTHFDDDNGKPLSGGRVFFYEAGTNTPKDTYTDANSNIPNTNPVVLNARGDASIWLKAGEPYKAVICRPDLTVVRTVDNITRDAADDGVLTLTLEALASTEQAKDAALAAKAAAEDARDVATTSAGTANSQANRAESEADRAESEADRAEAAADAAEDAVQYDYLVDDDAALAAIVGMSSGQRAYVRDTEHVWRYNGSAWVDMGPGPTAGKLDRTEFADSIRRTHVDEVVGGFLGAQDQAVLQVRASGRIDNKHIQEIEAAALAGEAVADFVAAIGNAEADKVVGGFLGADDKSPFQVRASGKIDNAHISRIDRDIAALQQGEAGDAWADLRAVVNFLIIVVYGQSLSIGALGTPPRSTTPLSWAKRFVGGLISRIGTAPARYASIVDLDETTQETITSGMLLMFRQLLLDEDGIDIAATGLMPFAACPGEGGTSAAGLSDGSTYFARLKTDITQATARAADAGLAAQVLAMPYLQGEQDYTIDTPASTWKSQVRAIRAAAEAHAHSTTGIERPLPMLLYQLTQHIAKGRQPTLGLAAVELCDDPYIGFATPLYFIPAVDVSHRSADGYFWIGSYFGLALKRWVFDGRKPLPMSPADAVWSDSMVSLRFPTAVGPLVFDTAMVVDPGDYGFRLYQADGTTPVTINSIAIAADRVVIRAVIPAGARLRYAWEGGPGDDPDAPREGPVNGARGCLRDSRGDTIIADPDGSAFPLHQFAPIFEEIRP